MVAAAIELHGLSKSYGAKEALRAVSLRIPPGQVQGLLGLNGAGKTTTLRILATLLDASAGTATMAGHDVKTQPADVRKLIGYVAGEMPTIEPRWSAVRYARFFGALYGLPRAEVDRRVRDLVDRLGFGEFATTPIGELSTGNKRKAELLRALLHAPPILLLDEPTRELDIPSRRALWETIKDHAERGGTVLLSTHDVQEVEAVCDRVAMIREGRLIWNGPTADLLRGDGSAFERVATMLSGDVPPPRLARFDVANGLG